MNKSYFSGLFLFLLDFFLFDFATIAGHHSSRPPNLADHGLGSPLDSDTTTFSSCIPPLHPLFTFVFLRESLQLKGITHKQAPAFNHQNQVAHLLCHAHNYRCSTKSSAIYTHHLELYFQFPVQNHLTNQTHGNFSAPFNSQICKQLNHRFNPQPTISLCTHQFTINHLQVKLLIIITNASSPESDANNQPRPGSSL
jgi:hypothetical protein